MFWLQLYHRLDHYDPRGKADHEPGPVLGPFQHLRDNSHHVQADEVSILGRWGGAATSWALTEAGVAMAKKPAGYQRELHPFPMRDVAATYFSHFVITTESPLV